MPDLSKPSPACVSVLTGGTPWEMAGADVQAEALAHIKDAARQIMAEPEKGLRRNMLGRIPAGLRGIVEAEAKRIHQNQRRVLTPEGLADFEERAAIMEFDGGLTRAEAEKAAADLWGVAEWLDARR